MKGPISTAVERAFDILELIGHSPHGLTNSELSRKLAIPKSSASYILRTMETRGYLRLDHSSGRYKLGFKLLILGRGVLAGLDLKETAVPMLRQLAERTALTANLAILDGAEVVYIEKAEAAGFIKMDTWVGRRLPAHATSVGKAILAFLPQDELQALFKKRQLERRTSATITTIVKLYRELDIIRRQGYSVDDEESSMGVRCIGAPIFGPAGKVEAAISVSGTTAQIDDGSLRRIAAQVRDTATAISKQLG
jgi:IclR family acetate operon transcriptional repressor